MKLEARLFAYGVLFFVPVGLIYAYFSHGEPMGTVGLPLLGGLVGMIGAYLSLVSRRIGPRPEDDDLAEVADGAGDQGVFSPWSWWPLVIGLGCAIAFLGLAVGWWLLAVAVPVAVVGLIGWVFEFSSGQHAH